MVTIYICDISFFNFSSTELYSKYFGETEAYIRRMFQTARTIAPVIVFIDNIDLVTTKRGMIWPFFIEWNGLFIYFLICPYIYIPVEWNSTDSSGGLQERVLSTLLNEMDGIESRNQVLLIGCTNQPHNIDDAILRPGIACLKSIQILKHLYR